MCPFTSLFQLLALSFIQHHILTCDADGILLLEINRMLRAGGYFVWAAQPVYKHEQNLEEQWQGMIQIGFHLDLVIEAFQL
jgi:hypothetical protein